ncbi:UNVERIFIED_CONTAM: Chaperonin-like RbcX protein 2, chloroplastic [Sesamum calycinum]|uniref:Chaperonin-like RbcX protein 2, chloroplastic n=1 Tax=Sesamum calycinum TaxID=2727403 RepID=A0AAW2SCC8_9LAMI
MVGGLSVVGSSLVDSKACPCLCLDALPSCNLNGRDSSLQRHSIGRKHVPRLGSLELSSSFLDYSSVRALSGAKSLRKQKKNRSLVVVDELAGQYEDNFEDVKKMLRQQPGSTVKVSIPSNGNKMQHLSISADSVQILDYFTYKAVRTVLNQLYEMNPTQYRWLYNYVASNEHGYGKRFIRNLVKDKQDLAERVMVTRLHLYGKWVKKCDHTEMYERISDQNLELMRERLMETVIWPSDDTNTEVVG